MPRVAKAPKKSTETGGPFPLDLNASKRFTHSPCLPRSAAPLAPPCPRGRTNIRQW